ncbi:MAG: hypothetical protein CMP48_17825 [Rickettsiales bacterium]|nr:hypothetical protein [Rickettsiales bacterium]
MKSFKQIEELAYSVFIEHADKAQNSFEVDVKKIASSLNIEIFDRQLDHEISGLLIVKDGKVAIGIDSSQHETRKRFTIAHELGHFFLHRSIKSTFVDEVFARSNRVNQVEKEANAFAAALLMPETNIRNYIKEKQWIFIDDEQIQELSHDFNVSTISMTYRLVNLRIIEQP